MIVHSMNVRLQGEINLQTDKISKRLSPTDETIITLTFSRDGVPEWMEVQALV